MIAPIRTYLVTAEIKTNLVLESPAILDALQSVIYQHVNYDADETVAAIPVVKLQIK